MIYFGKAPVDGGREVSERMKEIMKEYAQEVTEIDEIIRKAVKDRDEESIVAALKTGHEITIGVWIAGNNSNMAGYSSDDVLWLNELIQKLVPVSEDGVALCSIEHPDGLEVSEDADISDDSLETVEIEVEELE